MSCTSITRPASWLGFSLLLGGTVAQAQSPTVVTTALSPASNARSASPTAPIVIPFSQSIDPTTAGTITVFSKQYRGQRPTTAVTNGSTVTLTPTATNLSAAFKPGETVQVTVPATLQSAAGNAAARHVYQFTTATSGGTGRFALNQMSLPLNASAALGNPSSAAVGDIDGDGDLDMLASGSQVRGVLIRLNNGNGTFSDGGLVGAGSNGISLGDVDGDGDLDLVHLGGRIRISLNDGAGRFTDGPDGPAVSAMLMSSTLGDVDGDGDLDVLIAQNVSGVGIYLNDGKGTFSRAAGMSTDNATWKVLVGDIDGDGDLDFATSTTSGSNFPSISIGLNNGTGTFVNAPGIQLPVQPRDVDLGDIDGDGDLDLVVSLFSGTTANVYVNNGQAGFTAGPGINLNVASDEIELGDVDGDSDLDLLVNSAGRSFSTYTNNGTGSFSSASSIATTGYLDRLVTGDLDGDGDLDAAVVNFSSNTANILLNQNLVPTSVTAARASQLLLFPNPVEANAAVQVRFPVAIATREVRATLLNTLGQVVASAILPVEAGHMVGTLPTTGLSAGIYTVRLLTGTTTVSKQLIVF